MKGNLPTFDLPAFRYRITLGAQKYTVAFRFNTRFKSWHLTIFDRNGDNVIVGGIRLVYNVDLLAQHQHLITGSLIVLEPADSNGTGPTREDFRPELPSTAVITFDDAAS